jgi:hypothetical protein
MTAVIRKEDIFKSSGHFELFMNIQKKRHVDKYAFFGIFMAFLQTGTDERKTQRKITELQLAFTLFIPIVL